MRVLQSIYLAQARYRASTYTRIVQVQNDQSDQGSHRRPRKNRQVLDYMCESSRGLCPAMAIFHCTGFLPSSLSRASCSNSIGCQITSNSTRHNILSHRDRVLKRTRSMAPPLTPKPSLLSAHLLFSTYFLLSAFFLAVDSYKRMRLTTSLYGIQ